MKRARVVTFYIPESEARLKERLDRLAEREGVSFSRALMMAVKAALEEEAKEASGPKAFLRIFRKERE